jgi:hypothetical protein
MQKTAEQNLFVAVAGLEPIGRVSGAVVGEHRIEGAKPCPILCANWV